MADEFANYGQAAPMAIRFRPDDNTEDLERMNLGMELSHIDRMQQAEQERNNEMAIYGEAIAQARQNALGSTYLDDDAMGMVQNEFMQSLEGIKEMYKIPVTKRDISWYTQLSKARKGLNSTLINNDLSNRGLHEEVQKNYDSGKYTESEYNRWFENFRETASKGYDYKKYAAENGISPQPRIAQESLVQDGKSLISGWRFEFSDYKQNEFGYFLDPKKWTNTVLQNLYPAISEDAKRSFLNKNDSIWRYYGYKPGDEKSLDNAVKRYVLDTFEPYRPKEPLGTKGMPDSGIPEGGRDYYSEIIGGRLREIKESGESKTFSIPGASIFAGTQPEPQKTSLQFNFQGPNGENINLPVNWTESLQGRWDFDLHQKESMSSYSTSFTPSDGTGTSVTGTVNELPLRMNKQNMMNALSYLDGQKHTFQDGTETVIRVKDGNIFFIAEEMRRDHRKQDLSVVGKVKETVKRVANPDAIEHNEIYRISFGDILNTYQASSRAEDVLTRTREDGSSFLEANTIYVIPANHSGIDFEDQYRFPYNQAMYRSQGMATALKAGEDLRGGMGVNPAFSSRQD